MVRCRIKIKPKNKEESPNMIYLKLLYFTEELKRRALTVIICMRELGILEFALLTV